MEKDREDRGLLSPLALGPTIESGWNKFIDFRLASSMLLYLTVFGTILNYKMLQNLKGFFPPVSPAAKWTGTLLLLLVDFLMAKLFVLTLLILLEMLLKLFSSSLFSSWLWSLGARISTPGARATVTLSRDLKMDKMNGKWKDISN